MAGCVRGAEASLLRRLGWLAGLLWASPNTALGLVAGLAGMFAGARPRLSRRDGALVFAAYPWGPGGALTLGNVILATGPDLDGPCLGYAHRAGWCRLPPVRLGDHERAHVLQYLVLGPLFLPLYFACGGVSAHNRFEQAADCYAHTGHGWWPWPRPRPPYSRGPEHDA